MCDSEVIVAVARSPSKAGVAPSNSNGLLAPAAAPQESSELEQQNQVLLRNMEEMAKENFWLREKLKEMTSDRDRLLCEVANLRLELDMMVLKRLPDDNK